MRPTATATAAGRLGERGRLQGTDGRTDRGTAWTGAGGGDCGATEAARFFDVDGGGGLCLRRHQTHAKLSFMERDKAASDFYFSGLAYRGARGEDQNVCVWSQYQPGLEQCRRGRVGASYGQQNFYIRVIKSFSQLPYNGCRKRKIRRKKYTQKLKSLVNPG